MRWRTTWHSAFRFNTSTGGGAATNLQRGGWEPLCTPRDLLFERVDLNRLNEVDQTSSASCS